MIGNLSAAQIRSLRPFVEGQTVMDLGAGDLELAAILVEMGAVKVIAVDKEPFAGDVQPPIEFVCCRFESLQLRSRVVFLSWSRVVFLSWPVNWASGVVPILADTEVVAYLGKNTEGSSCGDPEMWAHLRAREVLVHIPERRNTLTVYGPQRLVREPLHEEIAAVSTQILRFDAVAYGEKIPRPRDSH